jgi:hypothetical protein
MLYEAIDRMLNPTKVCHHSIRAFMEESVPFSREWRSWISGPGADAT